MARTAARRRAESPAGGPGWGNLLTDALVLVVAVGLGLWIAEAVDWQGSRSFRVAFFGVILLGLLAGYAGMTAWNVVHADARTAAPRHARHGRRASRHSAR